MQKQRNLQTGTLKICTLILTRAENAYHGNIDLDIILPSGIAHRRWNYKNISDGYPSRASYSPKHRPGAEPHRSRNHIGRGTIYVGGPPIVISKALGSSKIHKKPSLYMIQRLLLRREDMVDRSAGSIWASRSNITYILLSSLQKWMSQLVSTGGTRKTKQRDSHTNWRHSKQ